MLSFLCFLLGTVVINNLAGSSPTSFEPLFVEEEDDAAPGYPRSLFYRQAMDGLRQAFNDKYDSQRDQENFHDQYKRSSGLKFIGLGKRDDTNSAQNGQKKKSSGMKYIGLGKRDSY